MIERLRIRRFLTTNYDYELERYLELRGFPSGNLVDVEVDGQVSRSVAKEAVNGQGVRARSLVFRTESAADLIEFAAGAPSIAVDIFHLHGRAGESDTLIITEGDYQSRYLKTDRARIVFDESLRVLFGGNPVLFIGHGMREADLLRPLRQFVSDNSPSLSRPLIALNTGI